MRSISTVVITGPGYDLGSILSRVSRIFGISKGRLKSSGKEPERVKAKSVAAFGAVRELGVPGTEVGKELGLYISDERNA